MSVTVGGYKRFEDETVVDVAPNVVALIGPNEAGKSSLQAGMMLLNQDATIDPILKSRGSNKEVTIKVRYLLDKGDWVALARVPGGSKTEKRSPTTPFRRTPSATCQLVIGVRPT
jgi:ABC-type Mn2+/Zn2+ transport system ATPase subunit